jgi:hypothetical protein
LKESEVGETYKNEKMRNILKKVVWKHDIRPSFQRIRRRHDYNNEVLILEILIYVLTGFIWPRIEIINGIM